MLSRAEIAGSRKRRKYIWQAVALAILLHTLAGIVLLWAEVRYFDHSHGHLSSELLSFSSGLSLLDRVAFLSLAGSRTIHYALWFTTIVPLALAWTASRSDDRHRVLVVLAYPVSYFSLAALHTALSYVASAQPLFTPSAGTRVPLIFGQSLAEVFVDHPWVLVPMALAHLGIGIPALLLTAAWLLCDWNITPGYCPGCSYDLRSHPPSGICPECGLSFDFRE